MKNSQRVAVLALSALMMAALLLVAGVAFGSSTMGRALVRSMLPAGVAEAWLGPDAGFPLQASVLQKVEGTFFKPVDAAALEEGAIRGMLAGLDDPYTAYFDPEEYANLLVHTQGSYSGVGIVVEMRFGFVTVVSTFKESPAEQAGVRPGDVIVAVDEEGVQGKSLDQVVTRIKGPEGTEVNLRLYRPASGSKVMPPVVEGDTGELPPGGETINLLLTRRAVSPPVLETEVLERDGVKVAHISFFTFSEGSGDKLRAEVEAVMEKEVPDAVILDLRSNGGGLVDEAVKVAGIFLPKGTVVATTEGRHWPKETLTAHSGYTSQVPLLVLVDGFTASASEIVAGALLDNGRATLVGERTFGKGLIQSIQALSNGGAVKITMAVYLTPSGADINGEGIEPNVEAPDDPETEDVDETLEKALQVIADRS